MYSSWWKPEGEDSSIPTDHDALSRDEATHRSIQADEEKLRPLDLMTIMSSKSAVKYWYLHRPKTMAIVHRNAVKIQSLGKSYATRKLIERYGIEYVVELEKRHAAKKKEAMIAALTEAEREHFEQEEKRFDRMVEGKKKTRREIEDFQKEMLISRQLNKTWKEEEIMRIREEERLRLLSIQEEKDRQGVEKRKEKKKKENEDAERAAAEALALSKFITLQASQEAAAARIAKEKNDYEANLALAYENSFGKNVPVTTNLGNGDVVSYNKQLDVYAVKVSDSKKPSQIIYTPSKDIQLDGTRIFSPKKVVDTPFGLGEVLGLDPHAGCYAIQTEGATDEGIAFVQIPEVHLHISKKSSVILGEEHQALKVPEEITMKFARIVDTRVISRTGKRFVQYKLEIQSTNYGTFFCWKRYSTFRDLCDRLVKEKGFSKKELPELPSRHILGNFSQKTIADRAEKLNIFLDAAVKAEHLQWGIRVDDEISVYKRRVKAKSKKANRK